MNSIRQKIYNYKYVGNYLNNYEQLISILGEITKRIHESGMKTMAINMVLESKGHRMGMYYSKGYEMANELQSQIKEITSLLIQALPQKLQPILEITNEKLLISKSDIEENKYPQWIRYAEPWNYFIIESANSSKLFHLDWEANKTIEILTDKHFDWILKNKVELVHETIYTAINQYKVEKWLRR
jgi:nucleoside diphosphate kinase